MKIVLMKKRKASEERDMFAVLCLVQSVLVVLIVFIMFLFTRLNENALTGILDDLLVIFSEDFDVGGYFTPSEGNGKAYELPGNMNYILYDAVQLNTYAEENTLSEQAEEITEEVFVMPVAGTVTSDYGYREHPVYSGESFHNGRDIAADEGSCIYAVADGIVTEAAEAQMAGKYVKILHPDKRETLYCHCSELLVCEGDEVEKGDVIALVGQTGLATGPHLHFELHENGQATDPERILAGAVYVY